MIQIGQKIHSILYGGRNGVVYAIHGEQRPQTIGSIGVVISFGGNAEFDIVFDNGNISRKLPESILYGVQWKIYSEVANAEEIQTMLDFAASETIRKADEAKKKAEEFSAAVAALRADPKHKALQQTGQGKAVYSGKLVAINIRRELKATFPDVKFSVRVDHYSEVRTTWMDGPIVSEVRKIVDKYAGGHFDGMHDIYEHRDSPWTTVFGSAEYVTTTRNHSFEALTKAVEQVCKDFGWTPVPVKTWDDGSAWVNLGDSDKDRILGEYLAGRYRVISVAA
jgi:hypothetical protein